MSEGVMSSYIQKNKGRKSPIYMSMCEKNMNTGASAVADKESSRRTIIELKELIVDGGIDENNVVVVADATISAAAESIDGNVNDRTLLNAANDGDSLAQCKSASAKEPTAKPPLELTEKVSASTNDDCSSSVTLNSTKCDGNVCGDDLCTQATATSDAANDKENAKQKQQNSDDDATGAEHDSAVFRLYCECDDCLEYREMLIQLIVEDREYNTLWDRLKALIREFYDVIPQNPVPYEGSMDEKYENMVQKHARWFSDGQIDNQKNIQLSLSSHLPLSNEMTFVLVFSMLYTRDPHQLFELLCIQLRCIAVAYSDGVKKLITTDTDGKNPKYNPIQLLDVILDGYDKFCSTATKLSSLLFELQRDHLQHFSLTWTLLNKRVYQRWVYFEVQDLIPECILMLKDLLDSDNYHTMAHRLIRFDEDMTSITQSWIEVWTFLQNYYLEGEEYARRVRISYLEEMLKTIRKCDFSQYGASKDPIPMAQWAKLENRQEAWLQMIDYLKKVWNEKDDSRLTIKVLNDNCVKCEFELASHYIDCECVTCSLAGGPNQRRDSSDNQEADTRCAKCMFYEQLDLDYLSYVKRDLSRALDEPFPCMEASEDDSDSDIDDIWKTNHSYHLAWAVFKHLTDRKAYSALKFDPRHFCMFQNPPCPRTECRVATHIIAGLFPLNFCKFLIKAYQPLNEDDRKGLKRNVHFTYLMQKNSMDLMLNLQDTDYTEFCHVGSTFAEFYLIDAPIPVQEILYSCFIVENNDIELNMYWLECIHMFRANENSLPQMQMDQIGLNGPKVHAESTKREKKLLSVLKLTDDTKYMPAAIAEAVNLADFIVKKRESTASVKLPLAATVWPTKGDASTESTSESSIFDGVSEEMVSKFELDGMDLIKELVRKSKNCKVTSSPTAKSKTIATTEAASGVIAAATDKDEPLTDAVKIAVKQKLNQKLEAELKVLKKEHSVLKEMVRDLEQIKENGENQMISKKDKCSSHANANGQHCCSDHSDMMDNHANHTKICHRGDGQCTCYYCTIFGHAECNHGRMNETRDRLRKRLHQIHSKSSTKSHNTKNLKSQPGINLKKLLATASNGNGNAGGGTASSAKCISKSMAEQKENNANETLEESLKIKTNTGNTNVTQRTVLETKSDQNVSNQQRAPSAATTTVKSTSDGTANSVPKDAADVKSTIKKRKLLNVNQHYQNLFECDYGLCSSCDEHRQKAKPVRMTPPAHSARTRGISPSKLSEETLASVRRASFCPVVPPESASLDDILDFIEGNTTSKKDSQKKAAKKAKQKQKKEDIKKIEDLEQLRTEFHDNYFKEFDAKNELKTLKGVKKKDKKRIAEMEGTVKKFGKFKAKVESNILELIAGLKKNNADFKFAYLPTKEQQQEWQRQQEEEQRTSPSMVDAKGNSTTITVTESATLSSHDSGDGQRQQHAGESASDQSKRMVTIRRINLPYSEPQVTVTAKGASPDKDKLLYTFINGQLIPGATPSSGGTTAAPSKPEKKSKTDGKQAQPVETSSKGKIGKKTNQPTQPVVETATKKGSKEKAKTNGKQSPDTGDRFASTKSEAGKKAAAAPSASATTSADKKKQKSKKNSIEDDVATLTNATKAMALAPASADEKPKKEKRKVRAVKFEYADPNYKVNQFDLLDMDEDDEYYTESSSSDEEEPPKPMAVANPKPVRNQPESTQPPQAAKRNAEKPASLPNSAKSIQKQQQQPEQSTAVTQPQNTSSLGTTLSKKQKKKLAQQQQTPVPNEKTTTKSLTSQMQRLQLNADTTIEMVNDHHHKAHGQMPPNVSIMDQLNRGVKVEGLMLPPGITLTRVDPNTAEGLRAKKESIGRLSHPASQQYQQPPEYQRLPPPFLHSNVPMNKSHHLQQPSLHQHSNGFIMVDPMQKQPAQMSSLNSDATKKSKAKKKKNKKSGDTTTDPITLSQNPNKGNKNSQSKIVTLRNPLFQPTVGVHDAARSGLSAHSAHQRNQIPPPNLNQQASITKSENGMYTIRNMALHQQLTNTVNTQYRPYTTELYPQEVKSDNFSYFSENVGRPPTIAPSYAQPNPIPPPPHSAASQQKLTQAIGSEIKSVHQNKNMPWYPVNQQQPQVPKQPTQMPSTQNGDIFYNMSHLNPQRSYSPFDASTNYGFNSGFFGASPTPQAAPSSTSTTTTATSNQYYNGGYSPYTANAVNSDSLFSSGGSVSASTSGSNGFYKSYDDNSFLNNLHPGQRLNSEVTIHNIGEAKFGRDPATTIGLTDGVEITRVNGQMPGGYDACTSRAVGSHRQSHVEAKSNLNAAASNEFGADNVFVPNQSVNLCELESEEREIESFKRFHYYFDPPKNKPKINFNVKDIVVTKKQPSSDHSSPHFGELSSSSRCNTPPPHPDEEYSNPVSSLSSPIPSHDLFASTPSRCDSTKGIAHQPPANLDNFLHGMIGDVDRI